MTKSKKMVSFELQNEIIAQLESVAASNGWSKTTVLKACLRLGLANQGKLRDYVSLTDKSSK